jgi:hypothetical protein
LNPQLTDIWGNFLQQQLGQGLTPFNLSSYLPSTGGTTGPGQLTAPLTPTMSGLEQFFAGQGGGPNPYTLPLWQSQLQAMQYPIQENLANIKEQFAQQGALGSSEMARALTDYGTQTALGQQALLGQETMQALPLQMGFGQGLQGLDQQAIQNMYQEFMRTQPQYNPLLQDIQSMATSFPPVYTKQGGVGSALIGAAGPAMQGLAALIPALAAI